jgi:hypothetical protein
MRNNKLQCAACTYRMMRPDLEVEDKPRKIEITKATTMYKGTAYCDYDLYDVIITEEYHKEGNK